MAGQPSGPANDRPRTPGADTRARLKAFGVRVTDYEERTRALRERARARNLGSAEQETLQRELAEQTASLHRALREITEHVYQLQSDALMDLVARPQSEV